MRIKTNKPKSVWIRGLLGERKVWVGRLGIIVLTDEWGYALIRHGKPDVEDVVFADKVSDLKVIADQLWDLIHREQPNA